MAKKSFIKTLLERRIPQILGSYFVAGTSLILFIEYLIDKYQFPSHYATLALFALIGILPSVIILSYFHGAPGKDEWTKVEKVGIPINVLFIAGILFFGDSLNIWEMDKNISDKDIPNVHLIYIGSPEDHGGCNAKAENILSRNEGSELFALSESELKNLRLNIESELYSEFYNQNITIQLLKKDGEIGFVNNTLKEYSSRKEFQYGAGGAYRSARKNHWLDEICSHMEEIKKPNNYWTKEKCKEEATKYNTRTGFRLNVGGAYGRAYKNGWLDTICKHMNS